MLARLATAQAEVITTSTDQAYLTGGASLSFSADLLGTLDTGRVSVAAYGAATSTVTKDSDGFYTSVSASAPMTTVTYDPSKLEIFGMGTSGGLTMTAPYLKSVTTGGKLTVTDLRADLNVQTIYATVIGSNGVGTVNNMALWHFSGLSSQSGGPVTATITGLSITPQGLDAFSKSLGLQSLGWAAVNGVTDFGTITTILAANVLDTPPPLWHVSSIPEPSTYALMGLGLVGLTAMKRRRVA